MERWLAKVIATVVTLVLMLISVFVPFKIVARFKSLGRRGTTVLNTLGCFTGGIFLGTCLLFLLPEVISLVGRSDERSGSYPLAEGVIAVGFVSIMFLERIVHSCRGTGGHRASPPAIVSDARRSGTTGEDEEKNEGDVHGVEEDPPVETSQLRREGNGIVRCSSRSNDSVKVAAVRAEESAETGEERLAASESATKAVILFVALSLDEFLGGLSMGLQRTVSAVWGILVGLLAHELVVGFSFGLQLAGLARSRPGCLPRALGLSYALVGPIGAAVGTLVGEVSPSNEGLDSANGVLQGLATGVFLYVTFFEILRGRVHSRSRYVDLLAVALGIAVMGLVAALPKGGEEGGTGAAGSPGVVTNDSSHTSASLFPVGTRRIPGP